MILFNEKKPELLEQGSNPLVLELALIGMSFPQMSFEEFLDESRVGVVIAHVVGPK